MGYTSNIDDEEPDTTAPEGNAGDFNVDLADGFVPGEHSEFSKIDLGYKDLDAQTDGFGSISVGKEVGTIFTGDEATMSILTVRGGIDGEVFLRAQTLDSDQERTTLITDAGLLNHNIGDLTGSSRFNDDPLDAHRDNQHYVGVRTLKEFDGIENGTLTFTGLAGMGLDGDPILSAGIMRHHYGEKWNVSAGAQVTLAGGDPRFDAGFGARTEWEKGALTGDFRVAGQFTLGADPTATIAAETTMRLTDKAAGELGDTFYGKEAGKMSAEFGVQAQYTDGDITTQAHLGLYRDMNLSIFGTDIDAGKVGVEITQDLTGDKETRFGIVKTLEF